MKKKVVVAMSGGVDSSVAAALLVEQGYDVIGVTLKLANYEETEGRTFGGCCGSKDFYDARSVAQTLGIPHYHFNYVNDFRTSVIDYFKKSYLKGETPNPCIACNQHVKFDRLLEQTQALGADLLATGHYAQISESGGIYYLSKAVDPSKDQSYVLYHLGQSQLSKTLFPVGGHTKAEIREVARRYGLVTADKPDSQEICFVPNNNYRTFISEETTESERPSGEIRHKDGTLLGKHRGLPYYTVGQREGLGLAVGRPLYVTELDTNSNTLVVGEKDDVMARGMEVREVSWIRDLGPSLPKKVSVKIRYKHSEAQAELALTSDGRVAVSFDQPQSAITPGQAAVFYEGSRVLGGGVIHLVRPS